jgi:hypothetical protein
MINDHGTSVSASNGDAATGPSGLQLRLVTSICDTASCPTIYESDRGTFVVQGYAVSPELAGVEVPKGELLVEIPVALMAAAVRTMP